ncbi:MAG: response regulator [Chthoniobacteraceae bacterium]
MPQTEPSILILEDTRTVQNYIRDVLQPFEAERPILLARKLADAQTMAASASIGLFIVDIGLPDGDGIDFLCEMSMLHPESRALIITSTPTEEYRERARQLGVLHFLAKPLDRKTLFNTVKCLLDPTAAPPDGDGAGFEGTLGGLSPVDIIQLKCLRGGTGVIEFTETHLHGRVWIEAGQIIHAECRMPGAEHRGIEAFQCIINWRTGRIRDLPNPPRADRTIHRHWQELLLDAEARRQDPAGAPTGA